MLTKYSYMNVRMNEYMYVIDMQTDAYSNAAWSSYRDKQKQLSFVKSINVRKEPTVDLEIKYLSIPVVCAVQFLAFSFSFTIECRAFVKFCQKKKKTAYMYCSSLQNRESICKLEDN